jgi:trimethylamine-N-oxide reductase cytochrome c-type subunit TorC
MMPSNGWLWLCAVFVVGGVIGAGGIIASTEINRQTSTDALCTSCHTMSVVVADPHYQQSAHEANAAGLRVGCSDCHIQSGNWFVETYEHVSSGLRDVVAEYTHNYNDPALWNKRRVELAAEVRDQMHRNDSATCRKCHDAAAIRPASEAGRASHAMLKQGQATCIDCHANIVHAVVVLSRNLTGGSDVAQAK